MNSPAHVVLSQMDTTLLTRGRIVIIGVGGIGLPLTRSVATFVAGLLQAMPAHTTIELMLCDGDEFELENSYRMDIPQLGNKAQCVAAEILERNQCNGLSVRWLDQYVTADNVDQVIQDGDLVLLACDNHQTRHLVGKACADSHHQNLVLISGGNDGIEDGLTGTYGNVMVFRRQEGRDLTAPLDRYHPEIANPTDQSPATMSCVELASSGAAQLAITNLAVASAMCNAILRLLMLPQQQIYDEVSIDVLEAIHLPHFFSE